MMTLYLVEYRDSISLNVGWIVRICISIDKLMEYSEIIKKIEK